MVHLSTKGVQHVAEIESLDKVFGEVGQLFRLQETCVCRIEAATQDAAIPIGLFDAGDLVGNVVERLVPADALPLVNAAHIAVGILATTRLPMLALHGVFDAVGREDVHSTSTSAQARAVLRVVLVVFVSIIRFQPDDGSVLHKRFQSALASAVCPADDRQPSFILGCGPVFRRRFGKVVLASCKARGAEC